jgi:hypothetical protein
MPSNASTAEMQTVAQVEYYWPGYDPTKALDLFEDTPVESFTPRKGVQIDYPGATTGGVYKWMQVNDLHVFATARIGQRRRGRWEGFYRVTFAK